MGVLPREFHSEAELTPQARRVYESGKRLWATVAAGNFNDSESPESWHQRADLLKEKGINGNGAGIPLAVQAKEVSQKLWATLSARDWRSGQHSDATWEKNARPLNEQALHWSASLNGRLSQTTLRAGWPSWLTGPSLPPLFLNPLFAAWLMWGRDGIGMTCLGHPATATAPTSSEGSATRSARPRPKQLCASSGSEPSGACHE